MSEALLRLIREELSTAKLTPLSQQKYSEIEEHVCRALMRIHELDDVGLEVLQGILRRLLTDLEKYAEIRILKSRTPSGAVESTVDKDVISAAVKLVEVEKHALSPFTVKHANRILYLFTKLCTIGERRFKRGDVAELTTTELIVASVYECGRVIEKPITRTLQATTQ